MLRKMTVFLMVLVFCLLFTQSYILARGGESNANGKGSATSQAKGQEKARENMPPGLEKKADSTVNNSNSLKASENNIEENEENLNEENALEEDALEDEEKEEARKDRGRKLGLERALQNVMGKPSEVVIRALLEGKNPAEVLRGLREELDENEDGNIIDEEELAESMLAIEDYLDENKDEENNEAYIELAMIYEERNQEKALETYEKAFAKLKGKKELQAKIKELSKKTNKRSLETFVNGKKPDYDVEPRIMNGRTIVPLRALIEALGAELSWNEETQTVIIKKGDDIIELPINKKVAYLNGKDFPIDTPAFIEEGRTLVPLRFIAEGMQAEVDYDADTQIIFIND